MDNSWNILKRIKHGVTDMWVMETEYRIPAMILFFIAGLIMAGLIIYSSFKKDKDRLDMYMELVWSPIMAVFSLVCFICAGSGFFV